MGSKGILYTFAFNLALASVDSTVDHDHLIKEGVTHTVADLTFGVLLRYSVGGAAGPVGWGLVGLGIIDTLFYDEKAVNKLCENGIANLQDSQQLYREGHYFAGFGLQQMAADQMRAASQAQAWHQIATITDTIASAIGYAWDKMTKPTPPPVPPSSIPTWNSSRMFQPANENSTNSNAVSNVPGHSQ